MDQHSGEDAAVGVVVNPGEEDGQGENLESENSEFIAAEPPDLMGSSGHKEQRQMPGPPEKSQDQAGQQW